MTVAPPNTLHGAIKQQTSNVIREKQRIKASNEAWATNDTTSPGIISPINQTQSQGAPNMNQNNARPYVVEPGDMPGANTGNYSSAHASTSQAGTAMAGTERARQTSAASPGNVQGTGYQASKAGPAENVNYQGYGADQIAPNVGNYDAAQAVMDQGNTVEGRMSGLLSHDSDYMQQARTRALQAMNQRGLLNSNLAVGASHGAAIDAALPIAQQDASTKTEFDLSNLGYENEARRLNAGANLAREDINVGATNDARKVNAQLGTDVSKFNTEQGLLSRQFDAGAENEAARFGAETEFEASKTNAANQLESSKFNAQLGTDVSKFNAAATNDAEANFARDFNQASQNYAADRNQASQNYVSDLNKQNFEKLRGDIEAQLTALDASLSADLKAIEAAYLKDRNLDTIQGNIYMQLTSDIATILANEDDGVLAKSKVQELINRTNATFAFDQTTGAGGSANEGTGSGAVPGAGVYQDLNLDYPGGANYYPTTTDQMIV